MTIKTLLAKISPADRSGLTAVGVALVTSLVGDFALSGVARTAALVSSAIVAVYGVVHIFMPDNAVTLAQIEKAGVDVTALVASKSPAAVGVVLSDAAGIAAAAVK